VKTAALLIQEYGDLDTLLARAEEIKQPKRRETLINNADQIRLSRDLVTLDCAMTLETPVEDFEVKEPEADPLLGFLAEMEFRTLTNRVAEKLGVEPPAVVVASSGASSPLEAGASEDASLRAPIEPEKYEKVSGAAALQVWINRIYERGYVALDTETTGLDEMRVDLVGICLSVEPGEACYIPLAHVEGEGDLLGAASKAPDQMNMEEVLALLKPVFEDPTILKIGQNMKYDFKIFRRYGVEVAPIDDTMLLSYALHGGLHNHGMDALSERYIGHKPISIKSLLGTGKSAITFDRVPVDDAVKYAAEDADITLRLWKMFRPKLHQTKVTTVYETLERPMVPVLASMEMHGIKVDRDHLSRMSNNFAQKMAGLEAEIHELAGGAFNVGSPKQLGEILFDKLELPGGKKGKTGAYATGVDVLQDLAAEGHDLPGLVLDWRQMSKLKSTYTDALQEHIHPETGRVHTSYSIAGASTGRLASTDPNLQNIPIRTEEGRKIREAFVAEEGKVLVSLDYSQIELRILAHIANPAQRRPRFHRPLFRALPRH